MQLIQKVAAIRSGDFAARFLLNRRDKRKVSGDMQEALKEYEIPLMATTIGNRNIYENSSGGLSVLEISARTESDREGQREMREIISEIETILGIGKKAKKFGRIKGLKKSAAK